MGIGMRRLALPAVVAVLLVLASGCSAARPSPRTSPDPVEQAALAEAQHPALRDGVPIAPDVWTQLWTPTQAGSAIKKCVYEGSGGVLEFQAAPLAEQTEGMSFRVGVFGDISALAALGDFADQRAVGRLLDSCVALYPIDRRLWLVPEEDRGALYSYDITVLRRCLLAHGQRVPRMPSRDLFESLMGAGAPWNAYDQVTVANRRAWYALADACPALPPDIAVDVTAQRALSSSR
jgi:hypothetical protein